MMNDKGTYTQRTERNRFFSPALAASLLLSLISLASNAGPLAPATPVPSSSADYDAPHIDLFYFENDRLRRLDAYQRLEWNGAGTVYGISRKGPRIIAAIGNWPGDMPGWAEINSFDSFKGVWSDIRKENPAYPVTSCTAVAEAGGECTMKMSPLLARVSVRSISCKFSSGAYSGARLKNVKIYLTNVCSRTKVFETGMSMPSEIINCGRLSETDLSSMEHPEMVFCRLQDEIGPEPVRPDVSLYCYANNSPLESAGSPFTRLVIEGEINGKVYYYPLEINRLKGKGDGVARGRHYIFDITITRKGTDSPDTPAENIAAGMGMEIAEWVEYEA